MTVTGSRNLRSFAMYSKSAPCLRDILSRAFWLQLPLLLNGAAPSICACSSLGALGQKPCNQACDDGASDQRGGDLHPKDRIGCELEIDAHVADCALVEPMPDHINKPAWLSIADFLSMQYLRQVLAERRAAGAREPATCAGGAPLQALPDGNHGENGR